MSMKKKYIPILAGVSLIIVLCLIMAATILIKKYTPSKVMADTNAYYNLESEDAVALVVNGKRLESQGILIDGHLYLDYQTLHDYVDQRFYYDYNEGKLLYTTYTETYEVEPGNTYYYKGNKKSEDLGYEQVTLSGDKVLVSYDYVLLVHEIASVYYENPNRLVIYTESPEYHLAELSKDTQIRIRGGIKSDILRQMDKGEEIFLVEEGDDWDHIITMDGYDGYVKKKAVDNEGGDIPEVLPLPDEEKLEPQTMSEPVVMAWHQVTNQSANRKVASVLANTKGVNVISPTWFYLNDSKGSIASLASSDYVSYCHANNVEVWGLVSNLEDSSVDSTAVLTHTTYRENLVSNLISKAIAYKLDGINVDLESLSTDVGDGYIQFIRELSLKCRANDIRLSVDNYVPSNYTAFYNRSEQACYADYIIIMAYDEHYAGSSEGSGGSITYVTDAVNNTLKEVPANQTILGLEFYTRVWDLVENGTDDDGNPTYSVKSTAVGMDEAANMARLNGVTPTWDDTTGQYYVEYEKSGHIYKIWMEEEDSISLRLKLYQEKKLAGVSFWKLGFEKKTIWNTINGYVK